MVSIAPRIDLGGDRVDVGASIRRPRLPASCTRSTSVIRRPRAGAVRERSKPDAVSEPTAPWSGSHPSGASSNASQRKAGTTTQLTQAGPRRPARRAATRRPGRRPAAARRRPTPSRLGSSRPARRRRRWSRIGVPAQKVQISIASTRCHRDALAGPEVVEDRARAWPSGSEKVRRYRPPSGCGSRAKPGDEFGGVVRAWVHDSMLASASASRPRGRQARRAAHADHGEPAPRRRAASHPTTAPPRPRPSATGTWMSR